MSSSVLDRDLADGVLTLTLNRPEQRNAIGPELRAALAARLDEAATDAEVRAVVVTGAQQTFCAGADVGHLGELRDARTYRWLSHRLSAMIDALERLEKPTIALVDGVAAGAGVALALACDWRIGTDRTRLLYREGRLGLLPTHGGCARLVKLVGLARAQEAILGGDDLDAAAGYRLGLLSEIAPGDGATAAHERAVKMLRRAPLSYGFAKRVLQLAADTDVRSGMLAESLAQGALVLSEDHLEGLAAVDERRDPVFTGR